MVDCTTDTMGDKPHQKALKSPVCWAKYVFNYKNVHYAASKFPFETNTDPVIAKGPEVMPDSNTTPQKRHNATGLLADHAECSLTQAIGLVSIQH